MSWDCGSSSDPAAQLLHCGGGIGLVRDEKVITKAIDAAPQLETAWSVQGESMQSWWWSEWWICSPLKSPDTACRRAYNILVYRLKTETLRKQARQSWDEISVPSPTKPSVYKSSQSRIRQTTLIGSIRRCGRAARPTAEGALQKGSAHICRRSAAFAPFQKKWQPARRSQS